MYTHHESNRQTLGKQRGQAAAHGQSTAIHEGRQQQGDGLAVPQGAGAALPGWWSPLAEPAAPSPRKGQSAAGAGCPHPGQFLETGRTQPTLPNGASAGHALQGPGEGAQPPGDVNHFSSSRLTAGVAQLPWPRSRDTHGSGVTSCSQESIRVICHHPSPRLEPGRSAGADRKSTRLNSSHVAISYAVFCLKKKTGLLVVRLQAGERYAYRY